MRNPQPQTGVTERFTSRNFNLRRRKIDKMDLDTAMMWRAHGIMARAALPDNPWILSKLNALTKRIEFLQGEAGGETYRYAAI